MIERASSPEERLLRLIRGQGAEPSAASTTGQTPPAAPQLRRGGWWRFSSSSTLLVVNIIVGLLLAGWLAGIAWVWLRPVRLPDAASASTPLELPLPPPAPPALNLQPFQSRGLFQNPLTGAAETPAGPSPAELQKQAQDAVAPLTLMGIMDGAPPQAIIADSQTQKSYFVKEGETFGAGLVLEKIGQDRVTIKAQGVAVELHL